MEILKQDKLIIRQKKELAELIGFESRNKYHIIGEQDQVVGYAAEQSKGFMGMILRQFLGHWRSFEVQFFTPEGEKIFRGYHPFRWFFPRFEVYDVNGRFLGALQKRFSIFTKKFDLEDAHNKVTLSVASPIWKIWTFAFKDSLGNEKARIEKKWSGLLKEAFTDTDNFQISFQNSNWSEETKKVLIAAAIFVDLLYFEKKAGDN